MADCAHQTNSLLQLLLVTSKLHIGSVKPLLVSLRGCCQLTELNLTRPFPGSQAGTVMAHTIPVFPRIVYCRHFFGDNPSCSFSADRQKKVFSFLSAYMSRQWHR